MWIAVDILHTIEYNEIANECGKGVGTMASSVLQVRVDEGLRSQAAAIYEDLGIDLQTAVRIFLKRSVMDDSPREKRSCGNGQHQSDPNHEGICGAIRPVRYEP